MTSLCRIKISCSRRSSEQNRSRIHHARYRILCMRCRRDQRGRAAARAAGQRLPLPERAADQEQGAELRAEMEAEMGARGLALLLHRRKNAWRRVFVQRLFRSTRRSSLMMMWRGWLRSRSLWRRMAPWNPSALSPHRAIARWTGGRSPRGGAFALTRGITDGEVFGQRRFVSS